MKTKFERNAQLGKVWVDGVEVGGITLADKAFQKSEAMILQIG